MHDETASDSSACYRWIADASVRNEKADAQILVVMLHRDLPLVTETVVCVYPAYMNHLVCSCYLSVYHWLMLHWT